MKYKNALRRSIVILSILALSVLAGILYQTLFTAYEKGAYPRRFEEFVEKYSEEYGVPEYIVYSVIKVESGFESGAVSPAGAVGLMQLTPDTFNWLLTITKESHDTGMLYDPETNIKYGTYFIAQLYLKYGSWDTVYAAYNAGMGKADEWLESEEYSDGNGKLKNIPYEETANYVKKVDKATEIYRRLYYEA